MALRLVRESSDTPNITNKDDTIAFRYAYGGYNGVVRHLGNECGYIAENGIFKVLDGRLVIDGWEIDIDPLGWQIDFSNVIGVQYNSIYAEINVLLESVEIKATKSATTYPTIDSGDDLTEMPSGTARLLLYNVKVENGTIVEVVKKVENIINLKDIEEIMNKVEYGEISNVVFEADSFYNKQIPTDYSYTLSKNLANVRFSFIIIGSSFNFAGRHKIASLTLPKGFIPKQNIVVATQGNTSYYGSSIYAEILTDGTVEMYMQGDNPSGSGAYSTPPSFTLQYYV